MQAADFIALGALVVALAAFLVSFQSLWADRRSRQDDLLITIHLQLISSDIEEGRRAAYQLTSCEQVQGIWDEEPKDTWHKINRALATYQFLAQMVERKRVDKSLADVLWSDRIKKWWPHASLILAWRRGFFNDRGLGETLERYAQRLGCSPVPQWSPTQAEDA